MFPKFILKKNITGSWITIGNEIVTEILLNSNFDFHVIDMEHSSITIKECENLIRLINSYNKPSFVRLTNNQESQIKKVLDAGANGLILPNIRSERQIRDILKFIFYPPKGNRGVGLAGFYVWK